MIYVTGDFHGNVRELLSRFDKLQTGEGDIIIVLGDAGLNYLDLVDQYSDCDTSSIRAEMEKKKAWYKERNGNK